MHWNTKIINPQDLIKISRGDDKIIHKYLLQFKELIPLLIESLEQSLKEEDRKKVRQILHQMSPQLQFFGIKDIVKPIRRLEHEYETMPYIELRTLVDKILVKLNLAIKDVDLTLKDNF
jgi:HPt (histidine-containing phosphotransfer) domain-containing protein